MSTNNELLNSSLSCLQGEAADASDSMDKSQRRSSMPIRWDSNVSRESFLNEGEGDMLDHKDIQVMFQRLGRHVTHTSQWKDDDSTAGGRESLAHLTHQVSDALQTLLQEVRLKKGSTLTESQKVQAHRTIGEVPPFSYLPNDALHALISDLQIVHYKDGEVILQQGDASDRSVYVLESGRIMMVQLKQKAALGEPPMKFLGYLDAPAYFGAYATLFDSERGSQIQAGGDNVVVYRMTGDAFQGLCQDHPAFRLKLALGLRDNGIFDVIEQFVAIVRRAVAHEKQMDFQAILASYRHMTPAIHANLHASQLDMEGWTYAIRRLPDSVTCTYVYLLAETVPLPFMHPNFSLLDIYVPTVARRRKAFAVGQGKLLVILRDNFSDVLDFLSLLCAHVHESAKLRAKLTNPSSLDVLHRCLWDPSKRIGKSEAVDGPILRHQNVTYRTASLEEQAAALQQLPLSEEEIIGLQRLWPKDYLYRIWDIIVLHENINVQSDLKTSHVTATDRWAERIRRAAIDLLCPDKSQEDICVQKGETTTHIISSNTTSVRNLLSPYILKNKAVIQAWGQEAHPEIMNQSALSESDKLCALCNAYMSTHPETTDAQDEFDKTCFKTLRHSEMTGIQVELVDLNALEKVYQEHNIEPDPYLAPCFQKTSRNSSKPRLLVNIDYAFGKQAEELISALSLLFGESLASVGVMGKAGGLQGKRGDIIVADYLIHQEDDQQTIIDNTGVDREALHTLSGRSVWSGGVLTVLGTLLQDTKLLNFYKKLYGCVSLEMEGSFYARELRRYKKAGLLSDDVNLRFLYYVSDTPLSQDQTETLSKDLDLSEVIPPQYAVTRELLRPALAH